MPSIKLGPQLNKDAVYIHSINKQFQNKNPFQVKRYKTSPERNPFQITPSITKVFGRAEIGKHQQSALLNQKMGYRLVQLKNNFSEEKPRKRWNSIQKEQYNHIKNKIYIDKLHKPTIKHRIFPIELLHRMELSPHHMTPQTINPFHEVRQKWFADKLRHHCKPKFFTQIDEKDKEPAPLIQADSNINKPFNFSLKLPKLQRASRPEPELLETIEIRQQAHEGKNEDEESIFCNRKIKKSLRNLQSQKAADLGQSSKLGELVLAVKRRRVKTIDYQRSPQTLIAPWNVTNVTKSIFY